MGYQNVASRGKGVSHEKDALKLNGSPGKHFNI